MRLSDTSVLGPPPTPLLAAAMLARDAQYAVKVVVAGQPAERLGEAQQATEQAGVDLAIEETGAGATLHFMARHPDRRLTPGALAALRLRLMVRSTPLGQPPGAPGPPCTGQPQSTRPVDVVAFRRASDALALGGAMDPEAELIWSRLLRAGAQAHLCGGIPTLIVNDVGGLVGLLLRRARQRGAAIRVNPEACACA
jgi:hypothetical protein